MKHFRQSTLVAVGITGLCVGTQAAAALVFSASATAPTANVMISQPDVTHAILTGDNAMRTQWRDDSKHGEPGQIFETADAFTLDKVTLLLGPGGVATDHIGTPWFMDILTVNFDGVNYSVVSNVGSSVGPGIAAAQDEFLTFDIDDVDLQANTLYAFRWGLTTGPFDDNITDFAGERSTDFAFPSTGTSPGALTTQGTSLNFSTVKTDRAFTFYLQEVPEPGTLALLGLGAVALLRQRAR